MSLQSPKSPVYRTSVQQKLKGKSAAKVYRYGTPKLRDMLREKCRSRMKEARDESFNHGRAVIIEEILKEEVAQVEADIELQRKIYKEMVDDVLDWFIEQQEAEEAYLINVGECNDVICPVCQREHLVRDDSDPKGYKCKCKTRFRFEGNVEELRAALKLATDIHEVDCTRALFFFVEPLFDAAKIIGYKLNGMCKYCDYFYTL